MSPKNPASNAQTKLLVRDALAIAIAVDMLDLAIRGHRTGAPPSSRAEVALADLHEAIAQLETLSGVSSEPQRSLDAAARALKSAVIVLNLLDEQRPQALRRRPGRRFFGILPPKPAIVGQTADPVSQLMDLLPAKYRELRDALSAAHVEITTDPPPFVSPAARSNLPSAIHAKRLFPWGRGS